MVRAQVAHSPSELDVGLSCSFSLLFNGAKQHVSRL